ncbi:MAG: AAA family ATPase [Planctomycetes bacterium]|nr:AAA family ATPase [Planctomycetota bacterium]
MDRSLEQRILRMLWREEEGEARSMKDLRSLPPADRALEGECILAVRFLARGAPDRIEFAAPENMSKFRRGDSVSVGDGIDFDGATAMVFSAYDAERQVLTLQRDAFARGQNYDFDPDFEYCVDRRPLGMRGRLEQVVRDGFADGWIRSVLEGTHRIERDEARLERARARLAATGLDASQVEAGAAAVATESLALIQGPPGTGKTRMLAEVIRALCSAGCRVAVTAFTHRAVDNLLLALRRLDSTLPLTKLGSTRSEELQAAGVRLANPRRSSLPATGCVVAGTCFALAKLPEGERFHFTVFDEAGQLPIPHAIAGMLLARRWVFVGDHQQLPPVITGHHVDREVTRSVFEHLHRHYGSTMLDVTYRMNAAVCRVVGDAFYGGLLRSAVPERAMRFCPGGVHDEVLDPDRAVVLARVDHLQPGMRSAEEANLVADLLHDLRVQHGVPAREIAVLTPFRAQVRLIRSALQRKDVPGAEEVVVDTVERMQGQEREVVLVSLAVGDPDGSSHRASFFFSTNRLNVAISRARAKVVLVASEGAFRGLPMDIDSLRAASVYKRLFRALPQVDLSRVYCGVASGRVAAE